MTLIGAIGVALSLAYGWPCAEIPEAEAATADAIREILVTVEECRTDSLMFGVGVNSDAGLYSLHDAAEKPQPGHCREGGAWLFAGPLELALGNASVRATAFDFYAHLAPIPVRKTTYFLRDDSTQGPRVAFASTTQLYPPPPPLVLLGNCPERGTGSLLFGVGVSSDAGLSGRSESDVEPRDQLILLQHPDERVRYHTIVQLGLDRAEFAIDALRATLAEDPSPKVRQAAARSLGLMGNLGEVPVLQRAEQEDNDEEVRHVAAHAVETIQVRVGWVAQSNSNWEKIQVPTPPPFQSTGFFN